MSEWRSVMSLNKHVNSLNITNLLQTAILETKRKHDSFKGGRKKSYNSLELDDLASEASAQVPLSNKSLFVGSPEYITIAERSITGSIKTEISEADLQKMNDNESIISCGSEYSFCVYDILLEIKPNSQNLKIFNTPKTKLKKQVLVDIEITLQEVPVLMTELGFFKPFRLYERSGYVKLLEPHMLVKVCNSKSGVFEIQFDLTYSIQIQECCLYVHPFRSTCQLTDLLDSILEWNPVPYETPYKHHEIIENGYDKISSSTFYNIISDIKTIDDAHDNGNRKLIIPELDTDLFKFQIKTVNWLLEKEGVSYNEHTHTVKDNAFFSPSDSEDLDKIGKRLDDVCFGWSRINLPLFPSNKGKSTEFWYNKYTGNLTSSKFAAEFLASIDKIPAQGLLAEEMGLGKTVEILALVLLNQRKALEVDKLIWDPFSQREILTTKTTLIICPDSILKQWYHEINNLASSLKITIYKGIYSYNKSNMNDINSENYKTPLQIAKSLSKYDIVLASYQTVSREIHHALYNPSTRPKRKCAKISRSKIHSATLEKDEDGNVIESNKEQINAEMNEYEERNDFSSPLVLIQFWRIVLDEVQMVSSKISNAAKIAKIIPRHHSWGVSGTPIRKDLNDLHSFLLFSRLYPFNDNLSSPRANSLVWSKLINDITVPTHFIRLFKNVSLRHTKKMVSEEIQLPPQKRILFITDFTPVERNLYDHMFEEFLATVGLNDKGDPMVDNWEPSNTVLAYMREWLIKLRQACCHSQIGTGSIIKRALNKNEDMHLRTVEAVLDLLIEDNENSIVSNERKLAMARIEKGQLYEHFSQPEKALKVFENCLPLVNELLINLKDDQMKWEKYATRKNLSRQEEQNISEKAFILKTRIRSWLEILHRLYFFIASAHFQIYSPKEENPPLNGAIDVDLAAEKAAEIPDEDLTPEQLEHRKLENEYYDKAELLRREILSDPIGRVNKLVNEIKDSDLSQFQFPQIEEPEMELIGLQATFFLQKYRSLVKELNKQALVLNKWSNKLTNLLSKLLKDDLDTGNDSLEDDYEESLLVQDNAYAYLDVLQKALKDRNDSLIGVIDQSAVTSLILRRQDDEDILIFRTSNTKTDFHKELEAERKSIRPEATFQPNLSLRSMILNSKELSDAMAVSSGPVSLEFQLFNDLSVIMKKTLDSQKKVFNKVKKDHFRQLNDLYNLRIEYYKSLQALSDHVKAYNPSDLNTYGSWHYESDEVFRHSQIDRRIATLESTKKTVAIRTRYLKSLKNIDSLENEEGRFCIICQSSIVAGVLTACGHQYCKECLDAWLKQSKRSCPMCKAHLDKDSIYNFTYTRANLKGSMLSGEENDENEKNQGIIHSIYQPIEEDMVRKIQDVDLYKSYGSKIDLILRLTKYLLNIEKDVQIVIFSQWSELLYLIGAALKHNGIQYLNSSETLNSRQGSGRKLKRLTDVDTFKKNRNITCFLLNAKAQASGLTLVNASHVFLCEPLVNTALELQAISRIHRIGQKKPTTIWMFAIENTVEESIIKLSTKKRLLYLNGTKKSSDTTRPEDSVEAECNTSTRNNDDHEATEMNMNETEIDTVNTAELTKTVEGMLDKKIFGGEVVPNDDLWSSFFS